VLSVLIPLYNHNSSDLVRALHAQCSLLGKPFEIICIDDASKEMYRVKNREVSSLQHVVYIELEKNLGRSGIRNLLAEKATYDYFLFMDCDSMPVDDEYIKRYLLLAEPDKVIYGGRRYSENKPVEPELLFHWTYGTQREAIPAKVRRVKPYQRFMTNNFFIPRRIYFSIRMDEDIKGYGHEDTLFSMEMERSSVDLIHIDNPLYHTGLEPGTVFLDKQRNAIRNLVYIVNNNPLAHRVKLYRFYKRLRNSGMMTVLYSRLQRKEKDYINNLLGPRPNIRSLDWLKLLWLHRELKS
jgi:glycosyltransferase involved in cell wall biosynthesis